MKDIHAIQLTGRTSELVRLARERGFSDRSGEWFSPDMFPDVAKQGEGKPVIIRRAMAFAAMLKAMANKENSKTTNSYEIKDGELIVGVIPLGSVGLGKEFPRYLDEMELRAAAVSHRDVESVFGHNSPDFTRVLDKGLNGIIDVCKERIEFLEIDYKHPLGNREGIDKKIDFYQAVEICCRAVGDYAAKYADLAEEMAEQATGDRKGELNEIARICRRVPMQPAETFHEALQSVWFIHLALHSTLNLMSLGRLDQALQPYLEKSRAEGVVDDAKAVELMECFLIKGAERLNLTSYYLDKQDHLDFGTGLGTNPIFLDQIASANNFLQNLVVGGQRRNGGDAVNRCSYIILRACENVGFPTPTVCARIHMESPPEFLEAVASCLENSGASLPIIYNDEAIIKGFMSSGIPEEEARDYVVDGCWEPILNAKSDWTFGMIHALTILECALNSGATLSANPSLLRGAKKSYATPPAVQLNTFEKLKEAIKTHIRFFTDQVALRTYKFFSIEGSVTPTPFFSALLGDCLKKGIDKTWGGADYILGGIIAIAMPNGANSLAAIKEWVYDKKKYSLPEVVDALRNNFGSRDDPALNAKYMGIKADFLSSPKFGNNESAVDEQMKWFMDEFRIAVFEAEKLADKIFLSEAETAEEGIQLNGLRNLVGYSGGSMKKHFGDQFKILFTAGAGTFGQYVFMGNGNAASADGRGANRPVAPNFSPASGTVEKGTGHILASLDNIGLHRFGAGVIIDLCIEEKSLGRNMMVEVLKQFVEKKGNIASISIVSKDTLEEVHEVCEKVREGEMKPVALEQYNHISVRVGGWNAPFITLTADQQEDYLKRMVSAG